MALFNKKLRITQTERDSCPISAHENTTFQNLLVEFGQPSKKKLEMGLNAPSLSRVKLKSVGVVQNACE